MARKKVYPVGHRIKIKDTDMANIIEPLNRLNASFSKLGECEATYHNAKAALISQIEDIRTQLSDATVTIAAAYGANTTSEEKWNLDIPTGTLTRTV